ncbi:MAG: hypothetical protein KBT27_06475 [Prevotellaceae bacterium]|nr:hypothetical protein [Candidatus Faecinaster equi]
MYNIYLFSDEKEKLIGSATNGEDAWKYAIRYIKDVIGARPHYYRECTHDNVTTIDYGSHTNFIHIKEDDI